MIVAAACGSFAPYIGRRPPGGLLEPALASLTLPDHKGLVLEVAVSTIAGAGRGCFVRCQSERSVSLAGGTALCGYAVGGMGSWDERSSRKNAAAFCFRDPGFDELDLSELGPDASPVWFEGALYTVLELLERNDVESIAGHTITLDAAGEVDPFITVTEESYFSPDREQPAVPTLDTLGVFFNDLAFDDNTAVIGYEAASAAANLLMLVFEVSRDPSNHRRLVPVAPIMTLSRDVTFTSMTPMEVGAAYGSDYWGVDDEGQVDADDLEMWML